ncbi:hypothetical protein PPL_01012 [Heterostelium album PN500]|uniref:MADS-box domain-containing protein n=1 Tax=Heterostelium pallidum (strain ATCC 26659 / Pp 5 / PN500) TaxID=670386 RepID=D3AXV5_HETP5|nr:hypothetical protein PPL_01012 [Heterostelium album PN500]EFA85782.1 hypothetical protein PPL_01012 [Heterostelium album PN500]|eukprot:XP_020437888.1 hypothetical protein PPL_01012 [Heterostelium album PN500]
MVIVGDYGSHSSSGSILIHVWWCKRYDKIRQTTFRKRKDGLFKKAIELSLLCDAPVYVLVGNPLQSGLSFYQYKSTIMPNEVMRQLPLPVEKSTTYIDHDLQRKFANHSKYMKVQKKLYPNPNSDQYTSFVYSPNESLSSSPNPFSDPSYLDSVLNINGKRPTDSPLLDTLNINCNFTDSNHLFKPICNDSQTQQIQLPPPQQQQQQQPINVDYSHNSKLFYNQPSILPTPQLNLYDCIPHPQLLQLNNYAQSCNSTPPSPSPLLPSSHSLSLVSQPMSSVPLPTDGVWNQTNFQLSSYIKQEYQY